jgi:cysteine-rich repeat protein
MRHFAAAIAIAAYCVSCTKHNPASCCTDPVQCATFGLDNITSCEGIEVCDSTGTCVAPQCTTDADCTAPDTCINELCTAPGSDGSDGSGQAVCGDGIIETGEVCDDGNTMDGDGCSSDCQTAHCFVPVTHPTIAAGVADTTCSNVYVYSGTYNENLTVARDLGLLGVGANPVTIDGQGLASVISITSGDVMISNITIQNGHAAQGAGILNNGSLMLDHVTVTSNTATALYGQGGGIYNSGPVLSLNATTVTKNHATSDGSSTVGPGGAGGGIYSSTGSVSIMGGTIDTNDVTVTGIANATARGAGLDLESGTLAIGSAAISDNVIVLDGNNTTGSGAGVYAMIGATVAVSITNTTIDSNSITSSGATTQTAAGGGIYLQGSGADTAITFETSSVTNNSAIVNGVGTIHASAGGLFADEISSIDFESSTVGSNEALGSGKAPSVDGGGIIANDFSSLTINQSTVGSNISGCSGQTACTSLAGGIEMTSGGTVRINASTVAQNEATVAATQSESVNAVAGAIYITSSSTQSASSYTLQIIDSTVSDNVVEATTSVANAEAVQDAGIVLELTNVTDLGYLDVYSSTITGNTVKANLGTTAALFANTCDDSDETSCGLSVVFEDSILAGNVAPDGTECRELIDEGTLTFTSKGYNILGALGNCPFSAGTGDQNGVTPELGPLANNGGPTLTHALLSGSPALNAGNPSGCPTATGAPISTDQRGLPRVANGRCDIGAYEAQ